MSNQPVKTRRYNFVVPESLYNELTDTAKKRETTVVELLRRYVKLGLLADRLEDTPDAGLFIREGDSEKQIIML
ncbi:hypothetical protein CKO41_17470 [Thiococcus pfennigii]|nr:hypothetical protein [Thiococcus pfennigii]